jgi:hypothetical protein
MGGINADTFLVFVVLTMVLGMGLLRIGAGVYAIMVLGALSIIVVMGWALASGEFLFAYIAYMVAFNGAVLMLFLSVILMLPIVNTARRAARVVLFVAIALIPPGPPRP